MTEIQAVFARRGFKAGDRLPPERELAKQLSVGRSSLREADPRFSSERARRAI
jgi:DNA-binding FadR family transcriptional regulator